MLTFSDLNSTFESSVKVIPVCKLYNIQSDNLNQFVMYSEKLQSRSTILHPYNTKIVLNLEEKYRKVECVYSQGLTPTSIYLAMDLEEDKRIVIKELKKSRMIQSYMHEFARNELAIHYSLSNFTNNENIVKVKEYFEDDKNYYMIMEASPDPNFFEDLLENVKNICLGKYLKICGFLKDFL